MKRGGQGGCRCWGAQQVWPQLRLYRWVSGLKYTSLPYPPHSHHPARAEVSCLCVAAPLAGTVGPSLTWPFSGAHGCRPPTTFSAVFISRPLASSPALVPDSNSLQVQQAPQGGDPATFPLSQATPPPPAFPSSPVSGSLKSYKAPVWHTS